MRSTIDSSSTVPNFGAVCALILQQMLRTLALSGRVPMQRPLSIRRRFHQMRWPRNAIGFSGHRAHRVFRMLIGNFRTSTIRATVDSISSAGAMPRTQKSSAQLTNSARKRRAEVSDKSRVVRIGDLGEPRTAGMHRLDPRSPKFAAKLAVARTAFDAPLPP